MSRYTKACLLDGGGILAGRWASGQTPLHHQVRSLVSRSESKRGILLLQDADMDWFQFLYREYDLDPAFVAAYVHGDESALPGARRLWSLSLGDHSNANAKGKHHAIICGTSPGLDSGRNPVHRGVPPYVWERRVETQRQQYREDVLCTVVACYALDSNTCEQTMSDGRFRPR